MYENIWPPLVVDKKIICYGLLFENGKKKKKKKAEGLNTLIEKTNMCMCVNGDHIRFLWKKANQYGGHEEYFLQRCILSTLGYNDGVRRVSSQRQPLTTNGN